MIIYTPSVRAAWKRCGAWQHVGSIANAAPRCCARLVATPYWRGGLTKEEGIMEHYRPAPGTPITDLDTPCLLIALDAVEHNFRLIAATYRDTVCKMRTHVKNLKS